MSDVSRIWRLVDREGLLAELAVTGGDFPWLNAEVRPTGRFEQVRPLFEEELRRLDHLDDDAAGWEAAYDRVREAVSLLYPDGQAVPEFLLHIDGHEACWRWSDEPFPDPGTEQ